MRLIDAGWPDPGTKLQEFVTAAEALAAARRRREKHFANSWKPWPM